MSDILFYIVKKGVYLQGVYGPFDTREAALDAFNSAYGKAKIGGEGNYSDRFGWGHFDGYHSYYIIHGLPAFDGSSADDMTCSSELIPYEELK